MLDLGEIDSCLNLDCLAHALGWWQALLTQNYVDDGSEAADEEKLMAAKSMVNAVKFMAMGEKYVPLDFLNAVEEEADIPLAKQLSERELQVLGGLCQGLSNKEIARELDLQEVTIKLHVKTLCRKIEAKNRTHAAMIAKEAGLF